MNGGEDAGVSDELDTLRVCGDTEDVLVTPWIKSENVEFAPITDPGVAVRSTMPVMLHVPVPDCGQK